jgi:Ser/Thr protein kinase RdoA (MazF antagonist)
LKPFVDLSAARHYVRAITVGAISDFASAARQAASHYGFSDRARLEHYALTENPTFKVTEDGGPAPIVVRLYRPDSKSAAEVRSELAWMTALREEAGLPVAEVAKAADGATVRTVDGGSAPVLATAFAWAPGSEPADDELPAWFPRLGEMNARMHAHGIGWRRPPGFRRMRWDVETTLGPDGHWGPCTSSVTDPAELEQHERLAEVVMDRLRRFGFARERFGLVHADLRLANVLVDGPDITLLDFDDCGDSWYLYDLAATLTLNEGRPDVDDLIASWVEAYRSVRPLPAEDEAEIKTFVMLRRLMISAYVGLRNDTEFAAELRAKRYSAETCMLAEAYLSSHA